MTRDRPRNDRCANAGERCRALRVATSLRAFQPMEPPTTATWDLHLGIRCAGPRTWGVGSRPAPLSSSPRTCETGRLNSEFRIRMDEESWPLQLSPGALMDLRQIDTQPVLVDQVHDRLLSGDHRRLSAIGQPPHAGKRCGAAGRFAPAGQSCPAGSEAPRPADRARQARPGRWRLSMRRRIRELYQVREALDGLAARLAAQRVLSGEASQAERADAEEALAAGTRLGPDAAIARSHRRPTSPSTPLFIACPAIAPSTRRLRMSGRISAARWASCCRVVRARRRASGREHAAILERHPWPATRPKPKRSPAATLAGAGEATARHLDANQQPRQQHNQWRTP